MDVVVTVSPNPELVDHVSLDPLNIFYGFPYVHCPPFLLSIVICHLLVLMPCLREMRLTVLSSWVPLESIALP